ncbi:MAG: ATP-binding protein [Pseudomonadota bacterium]
MTQLSLSLRRELSEVSRLCDTLAAHGEAHRWSQDAIHDLMLSLDELVSNAINHGNGQGHVQVEVQSMGDYVQAVIKDQGSPFDPREVPTPDLTASLEDRPIGGLGVFLAHRLMDHFHYDYREGINHITLRKAHGDREGSRAGVVAAAKPADIVLAHWQDRHWLVAGVGYLGRLLQEGLIDDLVYEIVDCRQQGEIFELIRTLEPDEELAAQEPWQIHPRLAQTIQVRARRRNAAELFATK